MRRVVAYNKRHLVQEQAGKQNADSKSAESLKNWVTMHRRVDAGKEGQSFFGASVRIGRDGVGVSCEVLGSLQGNIRGGGIL